MACTSEDEVGRNDECATCEHRHVTGAVIVACGSNIQHLTSGMW